MHRLISVVLVVLAVAPRAAAQTTREDTRAFWERMIAAKGGRERLRAVQTIAWAQTLVAVKHPDWSTGDESVGVAAFPDRLWLWEKSEAWLGHDHVTTWNGPGPRGSISAELEAWQLMWLLETNLVQPEPVSVTPSPTDAALAVVEAVSPRFTVRYTVDRSSFAVRGVQLTHRAAATDRLGRLVDERPYTFDGAEVVAGITLPRLAKVENSLRDLRFLVNPEVDAKLFEVADGRSSSPIAWGEFLLRDRGAAKQLAAQMPDPPPPVPVFIVGGGYDSAVRSAVHGGVMFARDAWVGDMPGATGLVVSGAYGAGGMRVAVGSSSLVAMSRSPFETLGMSVAAVVTRTFTSPRLSAPQSTYLGGEVGFLFAGVKLDLGVDTRVHGTGDARHLTGFRWSVSFQMPLLFDATAPPVTTRR